MSNLEHLVENGLVALDKGMPYEEWMKKMKDDCNWRGNENITINNLWEICQYVFCVWREKRD